MNEFFNMGGYAVYVWSSFGLALVVMLGNLFIALRNLARTRARIRQRNRAEQGQ